MIVLKTEDNETWTNQAFQRCMLIIPDLTVVLTFHEPKSAGDGIVRISLLN